MKFTLKSAGKGKNLLQKRKKRVTPPFFSAFLCFFSVSEHIFVLRPTVKGFPLLPWTSPASQGHRFIFKFPPQTMKGRWINSNFPKFLPDRHTVSIKDVICVKTQNVLSRHTSSQQVYPISSNNSVPTMTEPSPEMADTRLYRTLTIYYAKLVQSGRLENIWRVARLTLQNDDRTVVKRWYDTLHEILESEFLT